MEVQVDGQSMGTWKAMKNTYDKTELKQPKSTVKQLNKRQPK